MHTRGYIQNVAQLKVRKNEKEMKSPGEYRKGSQTELPEGEKRENIRKVIFEELMASKSYLTIYPTPQTKCHQIPKNLYHIDGVFCPQYDTVRNQ